MPASAFEVACDAECASNGAVPDEVISRVAALPRGLVAGGVAFVPFAHATMLTLGGVGVAGTRMKSVPSMMACEYVLFRRMMIARAWRSDPYPFVSSRTVWMMVSAGCDLRVVMMPTRYLSRAGCRG